MKFQPGMTARLPEALGGWLVKVTQQDPGGVCHVYTDDPTLNDEITLSIYGHRLVVTEPPVGTIRSAPSGARFIRSAYSIRSLTETDETWWMFDPGSPLPTNSGPTLLTNRWRSWEWIRENTVEV